MSVGEPFDLEPGARAAILWDVPTLRESGAAAVNLLQAFGSPAPDLDEAADEPLDVAALGVVAASSGDFQEARAVWDRLVTSRDRSHRLLGHLLRLWLAGPSDDARADLNRAYELASAISDLEDRARVCRKVAVVGMDLGEVELSRAALEGALGTAPAGSALQRSLRALLWELGDRSAGLLSQVMAGVAEEDQLLDQPWITDAAFGAMVNADLERFQEVVRGIWGGMLRSGPTPLDALNAAQRQADWAAAISLRDSLIRLVCAHLLDGAARSDAEIRWAATSWVLARGDRISSVLRRAERALDAATVRELIRAVARNPLRVAVLPQVAAAVWRHVGDDEVAGLLAALDPGEPRDPTRPEVRRIWANLLWRDPTAWYREWLKLDASRRQASIQQLHPSAVDELPTQAQGELLAACELLEDQDRPLFARIAIALAASQGVDLRPWFQVAGPEVIQQIAEWRRALVPDDVLALNVESTRALVLRARDEALAGHIGMGGGDARSTLGGLAAQLTEANGKVERLLIEVADDARMPAEQQMGALQGLVFLRHAGKLSDHGRAQIRMLGDTPGPDIWGIIDTTVLRMARCWVVADDLTDPELAEVEAGCRSAQRQVRLIAVAALGDVLQGATGRTSAAWTLVSALYDPDDEVLTRALEALRRGALGQHAEAMRLAISALVSAYRTGRNQVRRAAIAAAWTLRNAHNEAARLVDNAKRDPSWEVRYAATGR